LKKFLLKITLFLVPLALLWLANAIFYPDGSNDLYRVGYFYKCPNHASLMKNEPDTLLRKHQMLSAKEISKNDTIRVLCIGDSFTFRGEKSYTNYLAHMGKEVVVFDLSFDKNPLQIAHSLVAGNFLQEVQVDFIVLESVERHVIENYQQIDKNKLLTFNTIKEIQRQPQRETIPKPKVLFSDRLFKIPFINIAYLFCDKPARSKVYRVETQKRLFSETDNHLLFFEDDIRYQTANSNTSNIESLNAWLNFLAAKTKGYGTQLIFVPAADKYDFYYPYIKEKKHYKEPVFFEQFDLLEKQYLYLNSKKVLKQFQASHSDIYYYEDTHWSTLGNNAIATKIDSIMNNADLRP
jgi:hypothetical protein